MPTLTSRRAVLSSVAVSLITSLAGCSGGSQSDGTTGSTTVIDSVEIDGDQLVVTVASDSVAKLTVIGPNGEPSLGPRSVPTGATRASFDLLQDYRPGEHTIVAVDGEGNELASKTHRVEPVVQLKEFVTADMASREGYLLFDQQTPLLTLTNSGNAPATIEYVALDSVPNPTANVDTLREVASESGILDESEDAITNIEAGETVTGQLQGSPLAFVYDSEFECGTTKPAEVTIGYQGNQRVVEVPIDYRVVEEDAYPNQVGDQTVCNITVAERESDQD
jgi:hypothetical protein